MATIPATNLTKPTLRPIGTARWFRNPMMWVIPDPPADGASRDTSNPDTKPPVAPKQGRTAQAGRSASSSRRQAPKTLMPTLNNTPVRAAPSPVNIKASTTTSQRRSSSRRMLRLEPDGSCFSFRSLAAVMALSGRRLGAGHDLRLFRSAQHPTLFHKVIDLVEVEIAVELCGEWVDLFSGDPLVLIGCGNAPEQGANSG